MIKILQKIVKQFNWFEWAMILTLTATTLYFSFTDSEHALAYIILDAVTAICGILANILCAKGKIATYLFGLINVSGYIIIAWISQYYGEVMLNALYYLPAQFIGFYLWSKHPGQTRQDVQGKKLGLKKSLLIFAATAVGIVVYKMILDAISGAETLLDGSSTVISIVAQALMLLRYREQWLLWIIVDAITIAMWAMVGDPVMTVTWIVYLVNACYGWYNWSKLIKKGAKNV